MDMQLNNNTDRSQDRIAEVFPLLCKDYDAIYINDIEHDMMHVIKYSQQMAEAVPEHEDSSWDAVLNPMVDAIIDEPYQEEMRKFYSRSYARYAFKDFQDPVERIYRQFTGRWKKIRIEPLDVENGITNKAVYILSDITHFIHEMERQGQLKELSETDPLTRMHNRWKLEDRRRTIYSKLDSCGVLFFDVNDLKVTNDTHGHEAGDDLLQLASDSIQSIEGKNVHTYRYGGDEFIAVVLDQEPESLQLIQDKWKDNLNHMVEAKGMTCTVASGISWSKAPFDFDLLVREADRNMYVNKKRSKRNRRIK